MHHIYLHNFWRVLSCSLPASRWFLVWLTIRPWRCQLTFNELHRIIFRKIEFFITTLMINLNHTQFLFELNFMVQGDDKERNIFQLVMKLFALTESTVSILCSEIPAFGPYNVSNEFSSLLHIVTYCLKAAI
jgi:hypothetical protein